MVAAGQSSMDGESPNSNNIWDKTFRISERCESNASIIFTDITEDASSFSATQQDTLDSFFVAGGSTPLSLPLKEDAERTPSRNLETVALPNGISQQQDEGAPVKDRMLRQGTLDSLDPLSGDEEAVSAPQPHEEVADCAPMSNAQSSDMGKRTYVKQKNADIRQDKVPQPAPQNSPSVRPPSVHQEGIPIPQLPIDSVERTPSSTQPESSALPDVTIHPQKKGNTLKDGMLRQGTLDSLDPLSGDEEAITTHPSLVAPNTSVEHLDVPSRVERTPSSTQPESSPLPDVTIYPQKKGDTLKDGMLRQGTLDSLDPLSGDEEAITTHPSLVAPNTSVEHLDVPSRVERTPSSTQPESSPLPDVTIYPQKKGDTLKEGMQRQGTLDSLDPLSGDEEAITTHPSLVAPTSVEHLDVPSRVCTPQKNSGNFQDTMPELPPDDSSSMAQKSTPDYQLHDKSVEQTPSSILEVSSPPERTSELQKNVDTIEEQLPQPATQILPSGDKQNTSAPIPKKDFAEQTPSSILEPAALPNEISVEIREEREPVDGDMLQQGTLDPLDYLSMEKEDKTAPQSQEGIIKHTPNSNLENLDAPSRLFDTHKGAETCSDESPPNPQPQDKPDAAGTVKEMVLQPATQDLPSPESDPQREFVEETPSSISRSSLDIQADEASNEKPQPAAQDIPPAEQEGSSLPMPDEEAVTQNEESRILTKSHLSEKVPLVQKDAKTAQIKMPHHLKEETTPLQEETTSLPGSGGVGKRESNGGMENADVSKGMSEVQAEVSSAEDEGPQLTLQDAAQVQEEGTPVSKPQEKLLPTIPGSNLDDDMVTELGKDSETSNKKISNQAIQGSSPSAEEDTTPVSQAHKEVAEGKSCLSAVAQSLPNGFLELQENADGVNDGMAPDPASSEVSSTAIPNGTASHLLLKGQIQEKGPDAKDNLADETQSVFSTTAIDGSVASAASQDGETERASKLLIDLGHIAEGELTADVDGELAGPKLSVDETLTSDAVSFTPPLTTPRKSSGARLGDVSPDGEDATDTSVKPLDEAHKEFATTPLSSTICDAPKPSEGFSPVVDSPGTPDTLKPGLGDQEESSQSSEASRLPSPRESSSSLNPVSEPFVPSKPVQLSSPPLEKSPSSCAGKPLNAQAASFVPSQPSSHQAPGTEYPLSGSVQFGDLPDSLNPSPHPSTHDQIEWPGQYPGSAHNYQAGEPTQGDWAPSYADWSQYGYTGYVDPAYAQGEQSNYYLQPDGTWGYSDHQAAAEGGSSSWGYDSQGPYGDYANGYPHQPANGLEDDHSMRRGKGRGPRTRRHQDRRRHYYESEKGSWNEAAIEILEQQFSYSRESLQEMLELHEGNLEVALDMLAQLEAEMDGQLPASGQDAPELNEENFPSLGSNTPPPARPAPAPRTDFAAAVKAPASSHLGSTGSGAKPSEKGSPSHKAESNEAKLPWAETGAAVSELYEKSRAVAADHARLRNQYFQEATKAFLTGNKALAKELGSKGREQSELMKKAHAKASQAIYKHRNPVTGRSKGRSPGLVDLHGLHIKEALAVLEEQIEVARRCKPKTGRSMPQKMSVLVGTGHHTKGARTPARLPAAIEEWLTASQISFHAPTAGVIEILV